MIKVSVFNEQDYPITPAILVNRLSAYFAKKKISGEVSVAVVGKATMLQLARQYLGEENQLHNVLTFRDAEKQGEFVGRGNYLGEIVLCFPLVADGQELLSLLIHGAEHLLGHHHR